MKRIIYFIILCCLLFGSNNYSDLNNISIITNIGIEKKENNYHIILQEIIPKKSENKIIRTYKYYDEESNNLKSAFQLLEDDMTKELYLDHLENVLISTDNNDVLDELIDYIQKDFDHFNIIYTKDNLKKAITYSNNYQYMNHLIKNNTSFREVKKAKLEHKKISIPVIRFENKKLVFYKYKELKNFDN